jgi:hypothetical protein
MRDNGATPHFGGLDVVDVLDVEPGHSAVRERVGGAWTGRVDEPDA